MRYVLRGFLGAALMSAALALLGFAVSQLLGIGTCASGGPYVSARECPSGTAGLGLMVPASVFALLIGAGVWSQRGKPPGSNRPPQNAALILWVWTGIFWTVGGVCLATLLDSARSGPGGDLGAIIVAALFLPMGALGLLVFNPRANRAAARFEASADGGDGEAALAPRDSGRSIVPALVLIPGVALGVFAGLALGDLVAPDIPASDGPPKRAVKPDADGSLFRAGPLAARLADLESELGDARIEALEVTPGEVTATPATDGRGIDPATIEPSAIERLAARVEADRLRANLSSLVRAEIGFRGGEPGWCLQFSVDPPTQYSGPLSGDRLVSLPGYC